jgi:hypothetical protein
VIERWYERIYAIGGKYRGEVFEFYCRDSGLLELSVTADKPLYSHPLNQQWGLVLFTGKFQIPEMTKREEILN